jgi:hypothetical protein
MKHSILYLCFLLSLSFHTSQAQSHVSFEFQAYPTGLIPGFRYTKGLTDHASLLLRVGYNWIRHRDLGVHDDERGDGFGFTLGYTKHFSKFAFSLKNDVWWNTIDWKDIPETGPEISGQTNITVLQPTLEASYSLSERFKPTVAFGYEWNIKTEGEETGQGPILLIGFLLKVN